MWLHSEPRSQHLKSFADFIMIAIRLVCSSLDFDPVVLEKGLQTDDKKHAIKNIWSFQLTHLLNSFKNDKPPLQFFSLSSDIFLVCLKGRMFLYIVANWSHLPLSNLGWNFQGHKKICQSFLWVISLFRNWKWKFTIIPFIIKMKIKFKTTEASP